HRTRPDRDRVREGRGTRDAGVPQAPRVVHQGAPGRASAAPTPLRSDSPGGGGGAPRNVPAEVCRRGMRRDQLLRLMQAVAAGDVSPDAALERLAWSPVESVAGDGSGIAAGAADEVEAGDVFARVDHHRTLRHGYPEVVLCAGKTPAQLVGICEALAAKGAGFLATRADEEARRALAERFPAAEVSELARIVHLRPDEPVPVRSDAPVLVVSAGTSDLAVAEEAALTAEALGNRVERLYDVGVAGLHRLLGESETLRRAGVVIVVAGMEGAL